jgi:uncharacterized protein YcbK (DUF882 family)
MGDLSPHFSTSEFVCRCGCGRVFIEPELIQTLEAIREYAGFPVVITSGFRCPDHNAAAGGTPQSAHLTGEAADISISSSHRRFKFIEAAIMAGVSRIGVGRNILHIDVSKRLPQEVIWGYWG